MPFVENQGAKLYWDEQGSGEPLLLIMGLSYPSCMWHRSRPVLANGYRTIALDNRGVGQSDVRPGARRRCPAHESNWLRGSDLNRRPSGYELYKEAARLCLSMAYVVLIAYCFVVFTGILFPICSSICSCFFGGQS